MADQSKKKSVRIELTPEQRNKIKQSTGKDAGALEFSAEELEERIAPMTILPDSADLA